MVVAVTPEPLRGEAPCLLDASDDVLVQPFVADGAVVALDAGILLRLTRDIAPLARTPRRAGSFIAFYRLADVIDRLQRARCRLCSPSAPVAQAVDQKQAT